MLLYDTLSDIVSQGVGRFVRRRVSGVDPDLWPFFKVNQASLGASRPLLSRDSVVGAGLLGWRSHQSLLPPLQKVSGLGRRE